MATDYKVLPGQFWDPRDPDIEFICKNGRLGAHRDMVDRYCPDLMELVTTVNESDVCLVPSTPAPCYSLING